MKNSSPIPGRRSPSILFPGIYHKDVGVRLPNPLQKRAKLFRNQITL
ncbi:MAG: hypothetical protein F6K22_22050 [Okeania sp. SIO2F4]|nr:hypothetical protein [Okeania sp. SIO2F4]NES05266.1 hypothetical protein [Okeania sp. SIO2F4]